MKIMASGPIISWQIDGEKVETVSDFIFLGSKINGRWWLQPWNKKMLASWKKSYDKFSQCVKKQRYHFADKCLYSQSYGFSIIHVRMCEGRGPKNWCFWTVVLEKTLESSLDNNEIKPVNSKGIQPWIFVGMTSSETDASVLWPLDAKSQLIGKDPDAGKDWRQEEKGVTEDEMVGWHHWFNGHEFEQTQGHSEGQESLAWYSSWGC